MTQWGSTDEEIKMVLPGNNFLHATPGNDSSGEESNTFVSQSTFAITINCPAADVWPWIAQLGVGRAGFYSYYCGENIFGCGCTWETDQIFPEWQSIQIGDIVYMAHPKCIPNLSNMMICYLEREEDLVFLLKPYFTSELSDHRGRGTWDFHLISQSDGKTTRLLSRISEEIPRNPILGFLSVIKSNIFFVPVDFVMRRKMLRTIKRLAEKEACV